MPVGKAGELRAFASVGRYLQGPGAIAWLPQMTQRLGKSAAMLMGTHFYNREIDRIRGLFTEVKMEVTLHKISGSCTALEVEALKRMIAERHRSRRSSSASAAGKRWTPCALWRHSSIKPCS